MSVLNWIGSGFELAGLSGSKWSDAVFKEYFSGDFEINIGESLAGHFGSDNLHVFGNKTKLVFTDNPTKFAGLFRSFLSNRSGFNFLHGLSGDVSFCYGSRTEATYGGPRNEIRRGPTISKVTNQPLPSLKAVLSEDFLMIPSRDVTAEEIAAEDEKTVTIISVLSSLLYLVVASSELAMRFAYPNYPNSKTISSTIASKVPTSVVPRIMSLIQLIELAGSFDNFVTTLKSQLTWLWENTLGMPTERLVIVCLVIFGVLVFVIAPVVAMIVILAKGS